MATDIQSKQNLNISIKSYCADVDALLDNFNKSLTSIQSYGDIDGIPMQATADIIKSKIESLKNIATNFTSTLQSFISNIYEVDVEDMPIYSLNYIKPNNNNYYYSLNQPSQTTKQIFLERVRQLEVNESSPKKLKSLPAEYKMIDYKGKVSDTSNTLILPGSSTTFEYENSSGRKFAAMSQGDPKWKNRLLGDGSNPNSTVGHEGCGVTSQCNILSGYGYVAEPPYYRQAAKSAKADGLNIAYTYNTKISESSDLYKKFNTTSTRDAMIQNLSNGDAVHIWTKTGVSQHAFSLVDIKEKNGEYYVYGLNTSGKVNNDEDLTYIKNGHISNVSGWYKLNDIVGQAKLYQFYWMNE